MTTTTAWRAYKLVLSQDDKETLFSIVSGSPVPDEKSDRIVENHAFFREKMRGKSFDPARLWAGLNRVQVIDTSSPLALIMPSSYLSP